MSKHFNTVPLTKKDASDFINSLHRHHKAAIGDKFRFGAEFNGKLVGVCQVGRPVSRVLDDGMTLEVIRLCTDGTNDCCSFMYSKAARIAKELGYNKIITYILENESGASLVAAGWEYEITTNGGSWDCKSRPRNTQAPTCKKKMYCKILQ